MRVITGSAKGKKLNTLEGQDVRPTTDRVKESIFSMIQFELQNKVFLDLFAGSGQMGIEALSRGAKSAYFVDESKKSIDVITANLKLTGFEKLAKVYCTKAQNFLKNGADNIDIVFLDPPYKKGILQEVLPLIAGKMKDGGVIICENPVDEELEEIIENFKLAKKSKYGKIKISVYRHINEDD